MCIQKFISCKILQDFYKKCISSKIQEKKIFAGNAKVLQNCCKNFARFTFKFTYLARYVFLQEFCKTCIDCKNFARFLQKMHFFQDSRKENFCRKCESFAKLLQEFCRIHFQIHLSCKICIFTRILQNLY